MSGMVFEVGSVVSFEPVAGLVIQTRVEDSEGRPVLAGLSYQWSEPMAVVGFAVVVVDRGGWTVKTELVPVYFDRSGEKMVDVPRNSEGNRRRYRIGSR
jgi:hypothetical protein